MESDAAVGPARERLAPGTARFTAEQFDQVIGALTEGALCFPYPFDLAASSALAANTDAGTRAVSRFALGVRTYRPSYRVQVHEVPSRVGTVGVHREIVDTVVGDLGMALPLIEQAALDLGLNDQSTGTE